MPKQDTGEPRPLRARGEGQRRPARPEAVRARVGRPPARGRPSAASRRRRSPTPRPRSASVPVKERLFAHPDMRRARARRAGSTRCSTPRRASTAATRPTATTSRARSGSTRARSRLRAPAQGLARDRRHDHRPHRPHRRRPRPAPRLLDPPGRPRRAADRPEADPRRLEAARGDGDLPRLRPQRPLRRRRRRHVDRPDPAAAEAAARAAACSPTTRIEIYAGGRDDIRSGQIDRRVLATLEYLAESGLRPTVTCLKSGHSFYTTLGQRLRALAPATRSTSPRSTASRSSATRSRAASPSRPCAG